MGTVVTDRRPVFVQASGNDPKVVHHGGGQPVFYGPGPKCAPGSPDCEGRLDPGDDMRLDSARWFIGDGHLFEKTG